MAKTMNPLVPLAALGAGLFALLASKKSSALEPGTPGTTTLPGGTVVPAPTLPATPPAAGANRVNFSANGHNWILVPITGQSLATVDVYAPAGSWGPHGELRVCRFTQVDASSLSSPRVLAGVADGVPKAVLDAAIKDLSIVVPSSGPAATSTTPAGRPAMPASLQQEMVAVMTALGVDAGGVVRGPVTAEAIRRATELSSRLEQAGYPEAAAAMRQYAQAAGKLLPPPATPAPAIPGVPAELMAQIQRALELERDPAKLETLEGALKTLPASSERDMLIGALDALILQIRTAQAMSTAATEIEAATATPIPGTPFLPPYPTASTAAAATGTRILKSTSPMMTGDDVRAWQQVLKAGGYPVTVDGVFGPATNAATKAWQLAHGLVPDGQVGPATRAKIGTPGSVIVPAASASSTSSPRALKLSAPMMTGDDVRAWQAVLAASGYPVTADGVFGSATAAATKDWQSKHGLPADGVVGPATRAKIGTPPTAPMSVPATAAPRPDPLPKSALGVAAESTATHLLALQQKWGVAGSKGKQDVALVKRFQSAAGGVADGLPGVGTLLALAKAGIGVLPAVMYWPKAGTKAKDLPAYRRELQAIANSARAQGNATLAAQLEASAARETGAGGLK